ncbi:MAG: hypothetical protein IPG34_05410 [Rhodocyclaceae bacterium]|nr:hypothetical protein [Rhodocyclaceae bacterium]
MNYFVSVLTIAAACVASAAALNWTVDPAGIFRATSFGQRYAKALVISEHGLEFPQSLDEREFKAPLADIANRSDCVVIGSSRIMQVGSSRKHRSFPVCEKIINLGVSGAVIQDHVVLTWLALKNKPVNLILGVDPWTFAYGNDERWKIRYAEQYPAARMEIDAESLDYSTSANTNRWSNLANAQYTKRSLYQLLSGTKTPSIVPAINVDEDFGGETSIVLPDGSLIYSAKYVSEAKQRVFPVDAAAYKVDGLTNDSRAVRLYQRLIMYAKATRVRVVLMMSPYHHNAWLLKGAANVKAMEATEAIVRKMGNETGVAVIGSFRPELAGCRPEEFYDLMHPMATCMARLTASARL